MFEKAFLTAYFFPTLNYKKDVYIRRSQDYETGKYNGHWLNNNAMWELKTSQSIKILSHTNKIFVDTFYICVQAQIQISLSLYL